MVLGLGLDLVVKLDGQRSVDQVPFADASDVSGKARARIRRFGSYALRGESTVTGSANLDRRSACTGQSSGRRHDRMSRRTGSGSSPARAISHVPTVSVSYMPAKDVCVSGGGVATHARTLVIRDSVYSPEMKPTLLLRVPSKL